MESHCYSCCATWPWHGASLVLRGHHVLCEFQACRLCIHPADRRMDLHSEPRGSCVYQHPLGGMLWSSADGRSPYLGKTWTAVHLHERYQSVEATMLIFRHITRYKVSFMDHGVLHAPMLWRWVPLLHKYMQSYLPHEWYNFTSLWCGAKHVEGNACYTASIWMPPFHPIHAYPSGVLSS